MAGNHGDKQHKKLLQNTAIGLGFSLTIIISIIYLVWLVSLIPKTPQFTIQEATIYAFNITTNPNLTTITSTIQLSITSHNPNSHIGIYYDTLGVYATYRDQHITLPSRLPSFYQDHNEVNVWSPFINGSKVPVATYNAAALAQDQSSQAVKLLIKISGPVKLKANSSVDYSRWRCNVDVKCPVIITFGSRSSGAVKCQVVQRCTVNDG